jgi:hypothetical protein
MSIMIRTVVLLGLAAFLPLACSTEDPGTDARGRDIASAKAEDPAVFWNSATIYFLLTDRFENGDPTNDLALGRAQDGAVLRHFQGGDLAGILQKLEEGYFDALGVDAIWMTTATGPGIGPPWSRRSGPSTTWVRWSMRRTGGASACSWTPSSITPGR